MELTRAKRLLTALADGVDPFTGETLPDDSVCNRPDMIRAFHCILMALEQKHTAGEEPENAGKPWTDAEDERLTDEYHDQRNITEIAGKHGRSRGAIQRRLEKLGLVEPACVRES